MPATFIPTPHPYPSSCSGPRSPGLSSGPQPLPRVIGKLLARVTRIVEALLWLFTTRHTVLKALHHSESILIPTPQQPQFTCDSYLTHGITAAYNVKELVHRHTQLVVAELGSTPQVGSSPPHP